MTIFNRFKSFLKLKQKPLSSKFPALDETPEVDKQDSNFTREGSNLKEPERSPLRERNLNYQGSKFLKVPLSKEASGQTTLLEQASSSPARGPGKQTSSLTYSPQEIIPPNSPFLYYQKSLFNANQFQKKGELNTAMIIYKRVMDKISNHSIREKLETNLSDLNQMLRQNSTESPPTREETTVMESSSPQESKSTPDFLVKSIADKIIQQIAQKAIEIQKALLGVSGNNIKQKGNSEISEDEETKSEKETQQAQEIEKAPQAQLTDEDKKDDDFIELQEEKSELVLENDEDKKAEDTPEEGQSPQSSKEEDKQKQSEEENHFSKDQDKPRKSMAPDPEVEERQKKRKTKIFEELEKIISSSEEPLRINKFRLPKKRPEPSEQIEAFREGQREDLPDTSSLSENLEENEESLSKEAFGSRSEWVKRRTIKRSEFLKNEAQPETPPQPSVPQPTPSLPQEIHGVMEIKPPEPKDSPFLVLSYDFTKMPYSFKLSKNNSFLEHFYYKYKPMLLKAQKLIRNKQIAKALNYYRTIAEQDIPDEFRAMVEQNIKDITEFMGRYFSSLKY